ncbi:MAG: condensation domain-containing protein [Eubacteriales bacterium]
MESRKLYPLTPSQKLIFLAWQYTIHKQVPNIPTSCFVDDDLDLAVLKNAAEEAVKRNDAFAIRITKQGKEKMQYFSYRSVLALEMIDFTGKNTKDMEEFFYKIGSTRMPLYDKPLAKIYIVKSPDGKGGVFSCISHLIMDSWAISMFYKDIFEVYFALKDNEPIPKALPDYESVLQKEIAYTSSEKYKKDYAFWEQELSGPKPIFTHVNGSIVLEKQREKKKDPQLRFGNSFFIRTTAAHVVRMIEKEDVDKMKAFCLENGIPTMQVLFLLGIRNYLAKVNGREKDVSINSVVARRGTIDEKLTGGTRVHPLPFRTIFEEDVTFMEMLKIILEKQNILYRHADFDPMEAFKIMHKNYDFPPQNTYITLHLTFQPVPLEAKNGAKVRTKWYCNGTAASNIGVSIMDGDGTGALRCYYEYHDKMIEPETLDKTHNYMKNVILAGIGNPHLTLKELLDLPV